MAIIAASPSDSTIRLKITILLVRMLSPVPLNLLKSSRPYCQSSCLLGLLYSLFYKIAARREMKKNCTNQ